MPPLLRQAITWTLTNSSLRASASAFSRRDHILAIRLVTRYEPDVSHWRPDGPDSEVLGRLASLDLAGAAYMAAIAKYPKRDLALRQGARVIKRHDGDPKPVPPPDPNLKSWSAYPISGKRMTRLAGSRPWMSRRLSRPRSCCSVSPTRGASAWRSIRGARKRGAEAVHVNSAPRPRPTRTTWSRWRWRTRSAARLRRLYRRRDAFAKRALLMEDWPSYWRSAAAPTATPDYPRWGGGTHSNQRTGGYQAPTVPAYNMDILGRIGRRRRSRCSKRVVVR
jgi:hypothetical protein